MILLPVLLLLWGVPLSSATGRLRKFYLIDKQMLMNEAQNACRSDYTDLVTIYDEEENNELVDILSVSGWIGGSSCKWSNGDLATFTKYSRSFKDEKCCGAINTTGIWDCFNCNSTKMYFMCYDEDCGQESYRYSLIRENRTWFEAQRYCRENHTDLVIIRDDEENERVKKAGNGSHSFWIGLQYNYSLDWFDGGYSDYKQNSSSEGCFTFLSRQKNKLGGFWFKSNKGIYSALCYKSFIHVSAVEMSWDKALDYCNSNFSGLLRIQSENDQIEMERELKRRNISGPVWVGLKEIRLWIWTNGLHVVNWSNWKEGGQPENEHCGAIEKVDGQYKWSDNNCTTQTNNLLNRSQERDSDHLIKYQILVYNMSNIALVFLSALLIHWAFPPSTAVGRLRKFYIIKEQMERKPAEEECKINYTGLVTVYDQQDNMELFNLRKEHFSNAWIGTCAGNRSKKWSNGDDVTFNRNLTGYNGTIRCGAMKADGDWEYLPCNNQTHFMCYEQAIGVGRSYMLIRENKTWFEAQRYCRENHTDLVSIRNETENEQVMNKTGEQYNNSFWIGLLEDEVGWADGGQSAYRNWKSSNPDTKYYPEAYMFPCGKWGGSTGSGFYPLCYKSFIHVSDDNMSWEDALDYCDNQTNTTGLLTIQSENDQIETERELKRRNISGPVWVGLRQSRLFGFWMWINGLHVENWSNWKGGSQPGVISFYCGAIEEVDGQYKLCDKDCTSKYRVLCEGK